MSQKEASVCILDEHGKLVFEGEAPVAADRPANDTPGKSIDNKRLVHKALPVS